MLTSQQKNRCRVKRRQATNGRSDATSIPLSSERGGSCYSVRQDINSLAGEGTENDAGAQRRVASRSANATLATYTGPLRVASPPGTGG